MNADEMKIAVIVRSMFLLNWSEFIEINANEDTEIWIGKDISTNVKEWDRILLSDHLIMSVCDP